MLSSICLLWKIGKYHKAERVKVISVLTTQTLANTYIVDYFFPGLLLFSSVDSSLIFFTYHCLYKTFCVVLQLSSCFLKLGSPFRHIIYLFNCIKKPEGRVDIYTYSNRVEYVPCAKQWINKGMAFS